MTLIKDGQQFIETIIFFLKHNFNKKKNINKAILKIEW